MFSSRVIQRAVTCLALSKKGRQYKFSILKAHGLVTVTFLRNNSVDGESTAGACFSKVPKLYGPISGATISLISSQHRGSKPSNFAILLVFSTLKRRWEISFWKQADCSLTSGFSGQKTSRDFRETGPWSCTVVPYIRGVTKPIKRVLASHKVKVAQKSFQILRHIFSNPTYSVPRVQRTNYVYSTSWSD